MTQYFKVTVCVSSSPLPLFKSFSCIPIGLTKVIESSEGNMGIFDRYKFLFRSSSIGILTKLHMLLRYGLSPLRLSSAVSKLLDKFVNIYGVQQNGQSFKTVPDILQAMGAEDQHLTQVSMYYVNVHSLLLYVYIPMWIKSVCQYW